MSRSWFCAISLILPPLLSFFCRFTFPNYHHSFYSHTSFHLTLQFFQGFISLQLGSLHLAFFILLPVRHNLSTTSLPWCRTVFLQFQRFSHFISSDHSSFPSLPALSILPGQNFLFTPSMVPNSSNLTRPEKSSNVIKKFETLFIESYISRFIATNTANSGQIWENPIIITWAKMRERVTTLMFRWTRLVWRMAII